MKRSGPLLLLVTTVAVGQADAQRFRDPEDGAFDVSWHLATATGFLPIPFIITEPAVGYGGGLFAAFFHGSIEQWTRKADGRFRPPSISLAGGFATENGSWGAVAGHFGVWKDDHIRYLGGIGYVSPNLAVYPAALGGRRVDFNMEGLVLAQQLQYRFRGDLFGGARYLYFGSKVTFDRDSALPGIVPQELDIATGGVGVYLEWDGRDNTLSPTRGTRARLTGSFYGPAFAGDSSYQQLNLLLHHHRRTSERFGFGLRLDATASTDGAPFFAMPFVRMRGLPVLEYQGQAVALVEGEARYALDRRWTLIAFAGYGWTDNGREGLVHASDQVPAGGAGFRYLIARQLGLQAGVDLAVSPDQFAIYLQVGSAWF